MSSKFTKPSVERAGERPRRLPAEARRLHGLSDGMLAKSILLLARQLRGFHGIDKRPDKDTYVSRLLLDVVPELAFRLAAKTVFLPEERDEVLRRASDYQLRCWVWTCIRKLDGFEGGTKSRDIIDPWSVLTHDPGEGNPLAFAVDRIAPVAFPDTQDGLSKHVAAASKANGVDPPQLMWSPPATEAEEARPERKRKAPGTAPRPKAQAPVQATVYMPAGLAKASEKPLSRH
jgi:hypothetical protein